MTQILPKKKGRTGVSIVSSLGMVMLLNKKGGYAPVCLPSSTNSFDDKLRLEIYSMPESKSDMCTCRHTRFSHQDGTNKLLPCHFTKQCGCTKFVKDPKRYQLDTKENQ